MPNSRYRISNAGIRRQTSGINCNHGIVLLNVIIILLVIAFIGTSLAIFFSSVNISARTIADEAKALYLAEAGIAHTLYILRTRAGAGGQLDATIGPISLGEGTYTVKLDFSLSLITSTGNVHDIIKTVQLQYSSL